MGPVRRARIRQQVWLQLRLRRVNRGPFSVRPLMTTMLKPAGLRGGLAMLWIANVFELIFFWEVGSLVAGPRLTPRVPVKYPQTVG